MEVRANKFSIGRLRVVHISSIVNEVIRIMSTQFLFLQKNLELTKPQIKPKPTNRTKISQQKITKATIFCAQKLLKGRKSFVLRFLKN